MALSWGSKGIAYDEGRVFLATSDGYVVALDAATGKEAWKAQDFGPDEPRTMNGAPRVFAGKVIIGHGGADVSPLRGYVSAYDAKTGKLAWRFYTVPDDPSKPATTKAEQVMRPLKRMNSRCGITSSPKRPRISATLSSTRSAG